MPPKPSEFKEAQRGHLAKLDNLIERGSVPKLRKLYTDAVGELETKLAKTVKGGGSQFSIQQGQAMLAQAKLGLTKLSIHLGGAMNEQTAKTQEASANALIANIKKMEKANTGAIVSLPIEEASRFMGVVDKRRTSLMKLNQVSMAKYGGSVVGKMEQSIAMSLLKGETGFGAVAKVTEAMDGEWWRGERIVRTETAWAYNATQADAISESGKAFPNLMMRWVEYVADMSLVKLDERVGDDSCAMHGQLAAPGATFSMPLFSPVPLKISPSLQGQQWAFPPNRPNDRAVLQPWRPGWGWGYELVGGLRVDRQ